jgi:hypothetical protein
MKPQIINRGGYTLSDRASETWCGLWRVTKYTYTADRSAPLTYFDGSRYWRPDNHFRTDGASIPPPLKGLPGYGGDDFVDGFFHDSGYAHEGLWVSEHPAGPWTFEPMDQKACDQMLYHVGLADGARRLTQANKYSVLRLFGWMAWREWRRAGSNRYR